MARGTTALLLSCIAATAAGAAASHPLLPEPLLELGRRTHGAHAMRRLAAAVTGDQGGTFWDSLASNCTLITTPDVQVKTGIPSGGACSMSFNMYTSLAFSGSGAGGLIPQSILDTWAKSQEWAICAPGLECDQSKTDPKTGFGKCDAAQTVGSACNGFMCNVAQVTQSPFAGGANLECDQKSKKCKEDSDWGGPCQTSDDCYNSYTCVKGVCDGTVDKGGDCSADDTKCKGPYTCIPDSSGVKSTCAEGLAAGSACTSNDECWSDACNKALSKPVCAEPMSVDTGGKADSPILCKTLAIDATQKKCVDSRPGATADRGDACRTPGDCKSLSDTCACSGARKGTCAESFDVTSYVQDAFECAKGVHAACPEAPPEASQALGSGGDPCVAKQCKEVVQNFGCAVYMYAMRQTNDNDNPSGFDDARELWCPDFSTGLSTLVVIVIVVGCVSVVAICAGAIFIMRRKRQAQGPQYVDASAAGGAYVPPGGSAY